MHFFDLLAGERERERERERESENNFLPRLVHQIYIYIWIDISFFSVKCVFFHKQQ